VYLDGVDPSEMRWRWSIWWRMIAAGRSGDGGKASTGFHAQPEEADISLPVDLVKAGDTVTMGLQMESKQKWRRGRPVRVWTGIPVKTEVPKGALNVFA
jgi:hypothetical protein